MIEVSIIVPIYNSEKYIYDCINSVLSQTYTNFELILIDDGSTDSSEKICREFEALDNRVKYYKKNNEGVSSARNYGIQKSTGKYLVFLDSDDMIKENMIAKLFYKIAESDFSMCGYELFNDKDNSIIAKYPCPQFSASIVEFAENIMFFLTPPFLLGPCFKMFKADIVRNNNLSFPIDLSYGEDAVFVLNYLMFCNSVAFDSYIGYEYRRHGNETLSTKFFINKIDINFSIDQFIFKFLKKHKVENINKVFNKLVLEQFTSYVSELMLSNLKKNEKKHIFYEKYKIYKGNLSSPERLAQKIVFWAGKRNYLFYLLYLFNFKAFIRNQKNRFYKS